MIHKTDIKISIIILFCLICKLSFSQDSTNISVRMMHYMKLNEYKKLHGNLTKEDSLSLKFQDLDTLVLLTKDKLPNSIKVPYEQRDSIFLDLYTDVVFNKNKSTENIKMKYWKEDIKLFFDKSVDKDLKKELLEFAKSISSKIDSLTIYEVKERTASNFFIYEINENSDYKFEPRIKKWNGSGYYINWDGRQRLYQCNLEINRMQLFNKKLLHNKVKQTFFKALGQFYVIEKLDCTSLFSNCYKGSNQISSIDVELLKYHYSYGICKGTNLETFEEQHRIAQELLKKANYRLEYYYND
ncbi:hypothetical protein H7F37_04695 [Winogradskyella sp. PAMC22761]|nr:hypothetical protein H7F37_04695 [Winogradskyella sp. PAMC22761]